MSGNPILTLLDLNGSLQGQDRNGIFTATGSGALRWQPAEGARVNYAINTRFATNTAGWVPNGVNTVISRVADARFTGGAACRVQTLLSGESLNQHGPSVPNNIPDFAITHITVSFDAIWESGPDWIRVLCVCRDAAGSYVSPGGSVDVTLNSSAVTRHSVSIALNTTNFYNSSKFSVSFINQAGGAQSFLISNIVVEYGSVPSATYFDGSSAGASWFDPRTGQLGTAHASPSCEQLTAWVEEGTTNLVTNPWRATNNTGWAALNGSTARSTAYAFQGPGAGLLTASAANAEEYISITAAASSHTAQAIVRNNVASSRQCQLTYNGSLIGSPVSVPANSSATITAPFTGTGGAANLGVRWIDSANTNTFVTYYLGAEAKAYATSPCPAIDASGTVITGYSWAGTAHGSTSTRAGVSIYAGTAGRISKDSGEIAAKYSVQIPADAASHRFVFNHYNSGSSDSRIYLTNYGSSGTKMALGLGSSTVLVQDSASLVMGSWYNAGIKWDGSLGSLYKEGSLVGSPTAYSGMTASPANFFIGANNGTIQHLNGLIGPVAIYDAPLSDARRALVNTAIDNYDDLWSLFAGNPYTFFQLRPY